MSLVLRACHRHIDSTASTSRRCGWLRAYARGLTAFIEDSHLAQLLRKQLSGCVRLDMVLRITQDGSVLILEHQLLTALAVIDELRAHALYLRQSLLQQGVRGCLRKLSLELQTCLCTHQLVVDADAQQLIGVVGLHLVVVTLQGVILLTYCIEVFRGLRELSLDALITTFLQSLLQLVALLRQVADLLVQPVHAVSLCSEDLRSTLQIEVCLLITVAGYASLLGNGRIQLVIHLTEAVADDYLLIVL